MGTATDYEKTIRDLESWAAQIIALYEGEKDMEGADDLESVVQCYTAELRRRQDSKVGTLDWLAELKRNIRLAGLLLQAIQDNQSGQMRGWRHGWQPQNLVQDVYSIVFDMVQGLTVGVIEIEREHPNLSEVFNAERAAYRASLVQFEAEKKV